MRNPMKLRPHPMYDRHRRFKRIAIGGRYVGGYWLPAIQRTWGEVFIAKTEAAKMGRFFLKLNDERYRSTQP